jgi:hypothetical protein
VYLTVPVTLSIPANETTGYQVEGTYDVPLYKNTKYWVAGIHSSTELSLLAVGSSVHGGYFDAVSFALPGNWPDTMSIDSNKQFNLYLKADATVQSQHTTIIFSL